MTHAVTATGAGLFLVWLLMVSGVSLLADVVINELLPARFHWRVALRQRHYILLTMAFCYVAQIYVGLFYMRSIGLLIYYLWNACTLMLIALVDAHQRSKDGICQVICN